MNKLGFIACAALASVAGAADAQSSVTLYGRVEAQLAYRDDGTSAVVNFPAVGLKHRLDGLTSQFGFRGSEDLGDGMRAYFVLETRFKSDTGLMAAAAFFEGKSVAGLAGKWGDVYLGRDYVPAFYPGTRVDPFGYDGSIGSIVGQAWSGYTINNNSRAPNSFGYKSPRFAGFSFHVQRSLGEGVTEGITGANIEYIDGPAYLGVGVSDTDSANRGALLAGAYNFGFVRPAFWISDSKHAGNHGRGYALGLTAPIGQGTLKAVFHTVDPDKNSGNLNASFAKGGAVRTKYAIGYTYFLSKRTSITPSVAHGKQRLATVTPSTAIDLVLRHDF